MASQVSLVHTRAQTLQPIHSLNRTWTGGIGILYFSLAGQSNVSFWGVDNNDIGHTLRSIFIDPERRLMKVFEGTDWRLEDAERDIRNILKTYNI